MKILGFKTISYSLLTPLREICAACSISFKIEVDFPFSKQGVMHPQVRLLFINLGESLMSFLQ